MTELLRVEGIRAGYGDAVVVELSGVHRRYHVPLARTVTLGPPSDAMDRLEEAVADGLRAVLDATAISVIADGGTVTLGGRVHAWREREIAERAPDQSRARVRRVRQRAEHIEHSRDADLLSCGSGEPERRVKHRGEAESDADLVDARGNLGGTERDRHAQGLQHVGTATLRRRSPIAMLDHGHASRGDDDRRHRRDVHGVRAVASRSDDVDRRTVGVDEGGVVEHRLRQACEFCRRSALHLHADAERGDLRRRRAVGHDLVHRPSRLVDGQVDSVGDGSEDLRPGVALLAAHPMHLS
mgnify:CR=1 FL=1